MKYINHDNYRAKLKAQTFWVPFLIALPVTGVLLVNVVPDWIGSLGQGLETTYRYHFVEVDLGSTTQALEQEITFYQQRIQHDPEDGLDRASLAWAYLKMARATGDANWYLLAEQSARRSLANLPFDNQGAVLVLARIATARHDFAEAIRLAKQVLQSQPTNEEALSILVTANLAMGKVDKADPIANDLVNWIPTLGPLTQRALVRVAQGQDQAAIQDFQRAIAAEEPGEMGGSAWARTLLGRLYYKRGQLELAGRLYREALRILPRYPLALVNLAELEARLGHYSAAEHHYSQVFVSPDYPTVFDHVALQGMAQVQNLRGDRPGAEAQWNNAETLLRQHLNLNSFGHRRELARLLLARGRPKDLAEALSLVQADLRIRRDPETLDTLAWALSRSGRWHEAQQAMDEALCWGLRDAEMFDRAGRIEQALGNHSQAHVFFQRAHETDPTFNDQARRTSGLGAEFLGLN